MRRTVITGIDKFLGLNESISETNLKLGEASKMVNWRITDDFKLKKVTGYVELFASLAAKPIKGMFYFPISGTYHFVFACNGHIYEHNLTTHANTDLGALTDDITTFFVMNNVLYIQNGHEYKKWTGTGSIATVTGYRPRIAINAPPAGGGTEYEQLNLLNGLKEKTFTPDNGTSTSYILSSSAITSVDHVYVNEVLKTVSTDYTVTLTAPGKITFTVSPTGTIEGSIRIGYTQGTGTPTEVTGQYYNMFFNGDGTNDNRVFIWGKDNKCYYSGVTFNAVADPEYFPSSAYFQTDNNGFKITDVVSQYDRQVVFTNKPEAYFTVNETTTDENGNVVTLFYPKKLNSAKGMVAPNQTRIINNNPFTISDTVYEWVASNVRDERNAMPKGERVQISLDSYDLTTAITCDWETQHEYWLAVGKNVLVHQYRTDTWFKLALDDTVSSFLVIGSKLYMGTTNGQIMEFTDGLLTYNGAIINADWEMGFYDVEVEYLRKFSNETYISLFPESKSWVEVYFETDKKPETTTPIDIFYSNLDFNNIDFNDFSFLGNYSPQPKRVKTKARKWSYFKLILKNHKELYGATITKITMPEKVGGRVK